MGQAGELYYADRLLEPEVMTEDKMFTFPSDTTGLDIKGSTPRDGSVIVTKEGKVAIGVTDGKYCVTKGFEDTDVTVTEDAENCKNPEEPEPIMTSENSCIRAGNTCSTDDIKSGIMVNVKVNTETTETFYVLADDENKVTLILNRNSGDDVAWYADAEDNSYGPITALTYLQTQTSAWKNLPEMTINTFEDAYDNIKTLTQSFTTFARLPKDSEIDTIGTNNDGTIPTWLYINLANTGGNSGGYWTSTAHSSNSNYAFRVDNNGNVLRSRVYYDNGNGVRPVIELYK